MPTVPKVRRVLLKIGGESLCQPEGSGIDAAVLNALSHELVEATTWGAQIGLVVGGGNFLRGEQLAPTGIERTSADFMGMLATMLNGVALEESIRRAGGRARVMSSVPVGTRIPAFHRQQCVDALESGEVVVLVGGTGNPFFTTDTGASLRALEIGADLLLKGTKVDGVYSGDPKLDPTATKYDQLTYEQVLTQRLRVMDATAIALCRENGLPILVFDLFEPGNLKRALTGGDVGTLVTEDSIGA